LTNYELKQ